jgi:MerR family transcriptional regulator, thiopeptide resistance regulator
VSSEWTVGQVAEAAGVTVRTLHHWEAVGLLVPRGRSAAGYRLYDAGDLARLQRVLGFRALGFGLDEVRALLDDAGVDVAAELRRQSQRLRDSAGRLLAMADAIDKAEEARRMGIELEPHEVLEVFGDQDPTQHAAEAEQRWGDTDAYRESTRRARGYGKQDWLRLRDEQAALEQRLAAAFTGGAAPDSEEAMALAEEHRLGIDRWFYACSYDVHRGLGQLYVDDTRFAAHYDERAPGLAAWLCAAIAANAARHEGSG